MKFPGDATGPKSYSPTNIAITLVREIEEDERTPWYKKLWRYVRKHLMKGVETTLEKFVYLLAAFVFGLLGSLFGPTVRDWLARLFD